MTVQITTTAAEYEMLLEQATNMLQTRLDAAIGDDQFLVHQLPKSLADALNNSFSEGRSVRKWAEIAAKKISI